MKEQELEQKVQYLSTLSEEEINKELSKLNVEEFNQVVNHLAGKILEKRYESSS